DGGGIARHDDGARSQKGKLWQRCQVDAETPMAHEVDVPVIPAEGLASRARMRARVSVRACTSASFLSTASYRQMYCGPPYSTAIAASPRACSSLSSVSSLSSLTGFMAVPPCRLRCARARCGGVR